ncbi:MAG TPA: DUF697 domain-containing protein [Saprospiraceae bacterium]|nr:DUF697 domain-containing protein [Saprospiraceae bacterium]MCB9269014.1 DUF697 domain-containing protein [Lewinellaceae bacterium]HPG08057.1 DUF697 domain-containing protein [Saprospiraceae bacterium]HPQ99750.1 DUF697 domain-containing protein [Saprospiraceae bacterium]HQU54000.1 DUF697 domain-containing protein [Saprospiraceae bacterium]
MTDDKNFREDHAQSIIRNHMIWSMGAGFIPVPIADFFAVSAIQLDMIRQLCKLYEVDFKERQGKALVTSLTGSGLARLGARAVKFIPGVGSVLGGITMAVLSGASSFALGQVFIKHFETGGTILDFDVDRLKKYYNEMFEKGKEVAQDLQRQQQGNREQKKHEKEEALAADVVEKLKSLAELKSQGVITEEEFQKMKERLINA